MRESVLREAARGVHFRSRGSPIGSLTVRPLRSFSSAQDAVKLCRVCVGDMNICVYLFPLWETLMDLLEAKQFLTQLIVTGVTAQKDLQDSMANIDSVNHSPDLYTERLKL